MQTGRRENTSYSWIERERLLIREKQICRDSGGGIDTHLKAREQYRIESSFVQSILWKGEKWIREAKSYYEGPL